MPLVATDPEGLEPVVMLQSKRLSLRLLGPAEFDVVHALFSSDGHTIGAPMASVSAMATSSTPTLLVVHHTSSPSLEAMLSAVLDGTRAEGIDGVDVVVKAALAGTAYDVLHADAIVVGTPANIGYMSGALKHFFDQIYYPCLAATRAMPFGLYVHGNLDVVGAQRSVHAVATGLGWAPAHEDVTVVGEPNTAALHQCWDLGATLAAGCMPS